MNADFQRLSNFWKRKAIDFMYSYNRREAQKSILLSSILVRIAIVPNLGRRLGKL
jgi:hypothetical protein